GAGRPNRRRTPFTTAVRLVLRQIPNSGGAVVSWLTCQRGNGCVTRLPALWQRLGSRKTRRNRGLPSHRRWRREISGPATEARNQITLAVLTRYLRERTFTYQRKSNRGIWTGRGRVR